MVAALQCLPIFLVASKKLVLLMGQTYNSRLWCLVEICLWFATGGSPSNVEPVRLNSFDGDTACLDVRHATCASSVERDKLLNMIHVYPGGLDAFNDDVTKLLGGSTAGASSPSAPANILPVHQRRWPP